MHISILYCNRIHCTTPLLQCHTLQPASRRIFCDVIIETSTELCIISTALECQRIYAVLCVSIMGLTRCNKTTVCDALKSFLKNHGILVQICQDHKDSIDETIANLCNRSKNLYGTDDANICC